MRLLDCPLVVCALLLTAPAAVAQTAPPSPSPVPAPPTYPLPSPSATATEAQSFMMAPAPSASPAASSTPTPAPGVAPVCSTARINPIDIVNSKDAQPGQSFKFSVTSVDDARGMFKTVAPGNTGYGLVAVVRHARSGGDPGLLVLESRYVIASDGSHVPVSLMRSVNGLFQGKTRNSPMALGLIPYVSYITGTYDALHKGTDVAAGPADTLVVLLGDDAVTGVCVPPPPPPKPN